MFSNREQPLVIRQQSQTPSPHHLRRLTIMKKLEDDFRRTENIITRLNARMEVLDLMVSKSLPSDVFLARKEMAPWKFRKNDNFNKKWDVVNNVVMVQELLVAVSDARHRRQETLLKQREPEKGATKDTPNSEPQTMLHCDVMSKDNNLQAQSEKGHHNVQDSNVQSSSSKVLSQESNSEETNSKAPLCSSGRTIYPKSTRKNRTLFPKLDTAEYKDDIHDNSRIDQTMCTISSTAKTDNQKVDLSLRVKPQNEIKKKCITDNNDATVPTYLKTGRSQQLAPSSLVIRNPRSPRQVKQRLPLTSARINNLGIKTLALQQSTIFGFSFCPQADKCQYCGKTDCAGRKCTKMYQINVKFGSRQSRLSPSLRMKRRVADITRIYGFTSQ